LISLVLFYYRNKCKEIKISGNLCFFVRYKKIIFIFYTAKKIKHIIVEIQKRGETNMRKMHFEYVYKYKKYINFCGLFFGA